MNRPSGLLITAFAAAAVLTIPVAVAGSTVTASPVHTTAVADGPDVDDVDEVQNGFSWG